MTDETVKVDIKPKGNSLGLAAIILGAIAFSICWVPFLGMLGMPLSALGLLMGFFGLLVAMFRKGASIGLPIAGVALSGMALGVAMSMTGAIVEGIDAVNESSAQARERRNATNQRVVGVGGGDVVLSNAAPTEGAADGGADNGNTEAASSQKPDGPQWAPAQHPVEQDGVVVRVLGGKIGVVKINKTFGGQSESSEDYLALKVTIRNTTTTKKIDYSSWTADRYSFGDRSAKLSDEHGNRYKRITLSLGDTVEGQTSSASIRPGDNITDLLLFEEPIDAAKKLRLELPASAFGGEGYLRIEIPREMIRR